MTQASRIFPIKISQLSQDGHGVGYYRAPDDKIFPVEVPYSLPGDEGDVLLLKRKKGMYQGQSLEWHAQSMQRVVPLCQHFGACGGCRWQHMAYEEQLQVKTEEVKKLFQDLKTENTIWHPILGCEPPWNYRNKMEFSFSSDKAGTKYLGLILHRTRGHVFQIHECHLMHSWIIDAVNAVRVWWEESGLDAYWSGKDRGSLRTLTVREGQRTGDRMVILTVSGNPDYALNGKQLQSFVTALQQAITPTAPDAHLSIFLRIQQIAKGVPTQFYEMHMYGQDHIREILHVKSESGESHTLQFKISPHAFFQPNTRQAERLYSRAIELTQIPDDAVVYDLYCGTGTLGICMAKSAKEVIGIELSPESVLDARENVALNGLAHVTIHKGDVGQELTRLLQDETKRPDVVMVDPPRAGLDRKAIECLVELQAPQLTYISCNPVTQAQNVKELIEAGYWVKAVQPVDQFPHTLHVENIVVLERM